MSTGASPLQRQAEKTETINPLSYVENSTSKYLKGPTGKLKGETSKGT